GLHDGQGVVEGLEIAHERAGVGRLAEPPVQVAGIGRREVGIPDLVSELEDGARADTSVEMVVQQRLRRLQDLRGEDRVAHCVSSSSRLTVSGEKAGRQTATYSAPSGPHE